MKLIKFIFVLEELKNFRLVKLTLCLKIPNFIYYLNIHSSMNYGRECLILFIL
jgi:hypothetical protein